MVFFCPTDDDGLEKAVDSELPPVPRREQTETPISILDDQVDVDKLPRASANKKRKSQMLLDGPEEPNNNK